MCGSNELAACIGSLIFRWCRMIFWKFSTPAYCTSMLAAFADGYFTVIATITILDAALITASINVGQHDFSGRIDCSKHWCLYIII